MKKKNPKEKQSSDLRKKAEMEVVPETIDVEKLSDEEVRTLAHELQVHQIELEMQNEELLRAQQELEESRDRYSDLYDFAPVGYFTISEKGLILEANLTAASMLGVERALLIKQPLSKFIVKEDLDNYYRHRRKVCEENAHGTIEVKMRREDGSEFYAQLRCSAVDDEGDNTRQCRTIMIDITERKKLEEQQYRLASVVKDSNDAVMVLDLEGNILAWNIGAKKIYGWSEDEALKMNIRDIIPEEKRQEALGFAIKAVEEEIPSFETQRVTKDGRILDVWLTVTKLMDDAGKITSIATTERDITERKNTRNALIQAEKMKSLGVITAGISHEFNNILNIISGTVQLLQMDNKDNDKLMDQFRIILQSVGDGAAITDRMLDFAKAGEVSELLESADPIDLINQAIEFTKPRWETEGRAKGINYSIDRDGIKRVPNINCDTSTLREVFVNIINNALDAMPDGGTITVKTRLVQSGELGVRSEAEISSELRTKNSLPVRQVGKLKGEYVEITFADTGKGMTEEVLKYIFDPFFTTRRPEGTGLGMSIAYSIIKRHGGRIAVESKVGSGSTFTIQLPTTTTKTASSTVSHEPKQEAEYKGLRILVIDDEKETCDILEKFLSMKGYDVKTIDNGTDAIKLIESEPFNLVLCDHVMPDLSGCEVARFIAGLEKRPRVGIITGWGEINKCIDEAGVNVDFVIKKPFNLSELIKHINDVIDEG